MGFAPFRVAQPRSVAAEYALEPTYNALMSLAALNAVAEISDPDAWLRQTADALTAEQRRRNRLIFEGMGEALTTPDPGAAFPQYLAALAATDPVAFRNRLLHRFAVPTAQRPTPPTMMALLNDVALFLAQVTQWYSQETPDLELHREVHALLQSPMVLHNLVVQHLQDMWESYLQAEWQRKSVFLNGMITWLKRRPARPASSAADAIRTFIGRDLPPVISSQLEGVQRVVLTLNAHVGPWASRFGSDDTLWVFMCATREELVTLTRQAPIKRVELLVPAVALADDTRLHILEVLARHEELTAQQVMQQLDLTQSTASRHLKQLVGAGLVAERRSDGANKSYRFQRSMVDWLHRAMHQVFSGDAPPTAPPDERPDVADPVRRMMDSQGRFMSWPSKRREQQIQLHYLAEQFELDRTYTEKEVNVLLMQAHLARDPATLRRDLYDERLLDRTRDGARYWRTPSAAAPANEEQ